LSSVANVELKESINQIQRENAQRRIIVGFNVRNRDIQSTVEDLQKNVEKQLKLPAGYSIKYGGTFENLQQAKSRLAIAVPVSLLLILLMLYFAFNSIKYGLLFSLPFRFRQLAEFYLFGSRYEFQYFCGSWFHCTFRVAVLTE
jgi:cobalt-zinc-cadmium resistance protein CzcA